ncbi:hypothetical protein ACHQM5_000583 [Ranunculus cassubicifolius]
MVKTSPSTYEEIRQQRLEENKKRMEELNLTKLAQAVCNGSLPKSSPMKRSKPRTGLKEMALVEVRRSSRVANMPTPVYKEVLVEILDRPRRYSTNRRDLSDRVYASPEARAYATDKAEDFESKLEGGFPSFVKPMLQSHVTGGFWLGLPTSFSRKHLPRRDETVTLIDEKGDEWPTVYLAEKRGLSGGWRGFSIDHGLVDGDALVFELVHRTTSKVYIIRVNSE